MAVILHKGVELTLPVDEKVFAKMAKEAQVALLDFALSAHNDKQALASLTASKQGTVGVVVKQANDYPLTNDKGGPVCPSDFIGLTVTTLEGTTKMYGPPESLRMLLSPENAAKALADVEAIVGGSHWPTNEQRATMRKLRKERSKDRWNKSKES